jgi:hypothetical protein
MPHDGGVGCSSHSLPCPTTCPAARAVTRHVGFPPQEGSSHAKTTLSKDAPFSFDGRTPMVRTTAPDARPHPEPGSYLPSGR